MCRLYLNTSGDGELSTLRWEKVLIIRKPSLTGSPDPLPRLCTPPGASAGPRTNRSSPRSTLTPHKIKNAHLTSKKLLCIMSHPASFRLDIFSPNNQTFLELSQAKCFISMRVLFEHQGKSWVHLILELGANNTSKAAPFESSDCPVTIQRQIPPGIPGGNPS